MIRQAAERETKLMERAIALAQRGRGRVEPNPMVGCVIARAGCVIAEGYHRRFGGPHAEADALRKAGAAARGATAYVTLEPCCHHGKTPPCTEALIEAGLRRVVVAMKDPFAQVAGRGIARLKRAGIRVGLGICRDQAAELNAPYLTLLNNKRPYVILKWAQSIDGKIATRTGDSKWISSPQSRRLVHRLRSRVDGIMVGIGTVLADDPLLTARDVAVRRVATRIVLDTRLRLPLNCRLVRSASGVPGSGLRPRGPGAARYYAPQSAPVLVLTCRAALCKRKRHAERLRDHGVEIVPCRLRNGRVDLASALRSLGERQMTNLLVEGGGQVIADLLDRHLADEAYVFVAPRLIGGRSAVQAYAGHGARRVTDTPAIHTLETRRVGTDTLIRLRFDRR